MQYKGILPAWDGANYLAPVEPIGTLPTQIATIPVNRGIAAADMVLGRYVEVAA